MKRLGWGVVLLVFLYFIFLIRQDIIDYLSLRKELRQAARSLAAEKARAERLNFRLRHLNDDAYIEELARTRLGLIKKDETAYKVVD